MIYLKHLIPNKFIINLLFVLLLSSVSCASEESSKKNTGKDGDQRRSVGSKLKAEKNGKVLVYYFHTTYRCWTCNQFEKLTKEVLKERFQEQVNKGLVELKVINIEDPAHAHFVEGYRLVTKSLVISLRKDKIEKEWKNLDKIWILVRDTDKFKSYVREGIENYLGKI